MLSKSNSPPISEKWKFLWVIIAGLLTIFGGLAAAPNAQAADPVYDAFKDYSTTQNPTPSTANPIWSYGWANSLGGAFNLYPTPTAWYEFASIAGWQTSLNNTMAEPNIAKNISGQDLELMRVFFPSADYLYIAPGPAMLGNPLSVLRWTAPVAENYLVDVVFKGLRLDIPATTDVHVLHNSVSVFDKQLMATSSDPIIPFKTTMQVAAGDVIDFAVGVGSDGFYGSDSTGVKVTISLAAIPVSINIDPGSFIPGSPAAIRVTILGTAQMDVNTIDENSVRFGQNGTEAIPMSHSLHDVNHDRKVDLTLKFKIKDTGIKCFTTSAKLTALNLTGRTIEGSNVITTLGCERCPSP